MVFPGASDLQESEEKTILMDINERNNVRVYYNVSAASYDYVSSICLHIKVN